MIEGYDADDIFVKTCKKLANAPEYSPRGQKTKELIQETLVINYPEFCVVTNPERKLSKEYLKAELDWYASGDKSIDGIKDFAAMWERIQDENGEVNSNYGEVVHKQELPNFSGSQFDWVVESLKTDKDSRQAIINFNQPKHKKLGVKDFVCTLSTQYMIRDDKLIGLTSMRSNDFIYGFGNDFPFFSQLQSQILDEVSKVHKIQRGPIYHTVGSLHVYEKHFDMLERIANGKTSKSQTIERFININ